MTRRALVFRIGAIVAAVVVGVALFRWRFVLRQLLSRPSGPAVAPRASAVAAPHPPVGASSAPPMATVAVVTGGTPGELVVACLARLHAAERLAVRGMTVLVKPNVVSGAPAPTTTSPEVVHAVCEWLRTAGARTVWVGDMSAVMSRGTTASMEDSGIATAARQAGAIPIAFEEHGWVPVKLPGARYLAEVPVSEFVLRADRVINLPVIKSHRWATYSVCLKNFVGATHSRSRPYLVDSAHWEEVVAELNLAYRPDLNLVDGTRIMYAGGPWRGDEAPLGLVLAGDDRVACDAVALALIKTFQAPPAIADLSVWEQRQLRHARLLGLGLDSPARLALDIHHLAPPDAELRARLAQMARHLSP